MPTPAPNFENRKPPQKIKIVGTWRVRTRAARPLRATPRLALVEGSHPRRPFTPGPAGLVSYRQAIPSP
jgi:hypothetical protein